ncbi:MAG: DUF4224 domain-containing protein [Pseudomonadota bacterium]
MTTGITLTAAELEAITGYTQSCKQLRVLHNRGFIRAYISRKGGVVLERVHYETVSRGETERPTKVAKLAFFNRAA